MRDSKACAEVLEDFRLKVKEEFGICLSTTYASSIWVGHRNTPEVEMQLNYFGSRTEEIRIGLKDENKLIIGFGGNCILTTNDNEFDDSFIEQIHFVSEMFKNEARWRKVLLSLNVQSIIDEEKAKVEAVAKAVEEKKANALKAFADANIVVGSVIVTEWSNKTVLRMSGSKVQLDKGFFDKQAVGEKLLEGVWQVKK